MNSLYEAYLEMLPPYMRTGVEKRLNRMYGVVWETLRPETREGLKVVFAQETVEAYRRMEMYLLMKETVRTWKWCGLDATQQISHLMRM